MIKEDNDWEMKEINDLDSGWKPQPVQFIINRCTYHMGEDLGGICHAILLLVDAINDKRLS